MRLTQAQVEQYDCDGCIVFPELFAPHEIAAMRRELERIQAIGTRASSR